MRHVACGKTAHDNRRKSAYERLEKHLSGHRKAHEDMSEEDFKSHDTVQKREFAYVGDLLSGKATQKTSEKPAPTGDMFN